MSKEEYKGAIEVSVIFHEGQRMFAVPKQVAQQEPVAWMHKLTKLIIHVDEIAKTSLNEKRVNSGEFQPLYTSPPAQRKKD
jgi:hypothetical protein